MAWKSVQLCIREYFSAKHNGEEVVNENEMLVTFHRTLLTNLRAVTDGFEACFLN